MIGIITRNNFSITVLSSFKCHENEELPQQFLQGTQRHSVLCSHIAQCTPEIGRFFLGHCEASYSGTLFSWFYSKTEEYHLFDKKQSNIYKPIFCV